MPEKYRPISVTSSLAKVFERLLCEQTLEYLEKYVLLSNTQFGFGNKVPTIDAFVYCTESIRNHIYKNNIITAGLIELEETKRINRLIGNCKIPNVNCVKYLVVYLDCTKKIQEELTHVLHKMDTGRKTLKGILRPFTEQKRLLNLNDLVINHLHYSGLLQDRSKNNCFINLEK